MGKGRDDNRLTMLNHRRRSFGGQEPPCFFLRHPLKGCLVSKFFSGRFGWPPNLLLSPESDMSAMPGLEIERIFGFGVLQGGFYNMPSTGGNTTMMRNHPQWARLFI